MTISSICTETTWRVALRRKQRRGAEEYGGESGCLFVDSVRLTKHLNFTLLRLVIKCYAMVSNSVILKQSQCSLTCSPKKFFIPSLFRTPWKGQKKKRRRGAQPEEASFFINSNQFRAMYIKLIRHWLASLSSQVPFVDKCQQLVAQVKRVQVCQER